MRVKRQHKRLSFMLLALTAASLLSTSDLSSSLLYRRELSLIDDRNINIEDKDVLVVLDIQQTGMESFVDNVIRNVKVDTPCQCKQEMTKCKCLNSQGNHWFFNTYNTTGYVCGDHADFTTLTKCPIDYWFRSTGGDTRPYRRYLIMTMLRDPVERYLSEWMFTRNEDTRFKNEPRLFRSDSTELQKKGLQCYVGKKLADLTIEEFMDCKENQAQNRQTRMLANLTYVSSLHLTGDDYDKALLESAKNTLQTIPFFALFDRPNDNLKLFERTFKLQISPPPTLSKDESKESLPVSAAVKHRIIQLNSLDLKLYVLAKEIYQGRVNEMRSTSSKKDEVDNFQIVYRPDLEDKAGEKDDEDGGENNVVVEYDDGDNNEDEVKRQISAKDGGDQSSLKSGEELVSSLSRDKEMSDDYNDDDDGVNDERVFIDDVEKRHDRIKEVYENEEGMMGEEEEEGQEDKGEKVKYVEEEKNEEEEALNDKGKKKETDADDDITDEDNEGKIDEGNKSIEKSQSGISEDANLKDNIQKSLPDYPMDEEDVSMFFNRLAQSRQQQQQQKQQFQQLLLQQQQQKQNPPPNQPLQNQQLQKQQPQAQQPQQNLVARAKPLASSLSSSKTSKEQAQLLQKNQPLQQKPPAQPRTQASADSSLSSKLNSGDIKAKLIQQLQSINKPSVPSSDKSASINNVGGISHGGGIKPLLSSKSEVKREAVAPLKGRSQEEKDLHRMFL